MRTPPWALVQYRLPGDEAIRPGVLVDGTTVIKAPFGHGSLIDALADWDAVETALRAWSPGAGDEIVPGAILTAPVTY